MVPPLFRKQIHYQDIIHAIVINLIHAYVIRHCSALTGFSVREYSVPPCPSCATLTLRRKSLPPAAFLSERLKQRIPHILWVSPVYLVAYIIQSSAGIVKDLITPPFTSKSTPNPRQNRALHSEAISAKARNKLSRLTKR